ncbi:hypothetical protein [Streptosporangium sp. NPDC049376]
MAYGPRAAGRLDAAADVAFPRLRRPVGPALVRLAHTFFVVPQGRPGR